MIEDDNFDSKTNNLVNKYLEDKNFQSAISDLVTFCSKTSFNLFLNQSLAIAIDKQPLLRGAWGEFLGSLFLNLLYDTSEIFEGYFCLYFLPSITIE